MNPMIIEARVNEYAMRQVNPHVPWTPDEIADTAERCWRAGASILHYHARAPDGAPDNAVALNAEIIRKVRQRCDILVHPTLGFISNDTDPAARIEVIESLARDPATKPDFAPLDTGTTNVDLYDGEARQFRQTDQLYVNTTGTLIRHADILARIGVKPILVSWSVGFTRRALAMREAGLVPGPTYLLFHMTDGPYLTGHPGTVAGLEAHLSFLPADPTIHWTANVLGGSVLALAETIARRGGHICPGIGDYGYPELGAPTNEALIAQVAAIASAAGRDIASVADTRRILGLV